MPLLTVAFGSGLHPLILPFIVIIELLMYVRRRGGAARLWWRVLLVNVVTSGLGFFLAFAWPYSWSMGWIGEGRAPTRVQWVLAWVTAWGASVALEAWGLRRLDRRGAGHPDLLEVAMANLASYVPLVFFVQARL